MVRLYGTTSEKFYWFDCIIPVFSAHWQLLDPELFQKIAALKPSVISQENVRSNEAKMF